MESRRQKISSGNKFSFPIITPAHEFEFGCVSTSPGSPNSPADRFFFNGKLLLHDFPCPPATGFSYSRSTSSVSSSKDSLMSSRCNSSNSSRCSSARTSTSESSERKLATKNIRQHMMMKNRAIPSSVSQRWQFMATPALVSGNSRKERNQELKLKKQGEEVVKKSAAGKSFGLRILRSFVSTCKECHAIQPSNREAVAY